MDQKSFPELGYAKFEAVISKAELASVRASIAEIIRTGAQNAGGKCWDDVQHMGEEDIPHGGLLALHQASPTHMKLAVDRIRCSSIILDSTFSSRYREMFFQLVGAEKMEHFGIAHNMVRVDLPNQYKEEDKRLSLPWHQESAYYKMQASDRSSIVLWIPVFDCLKDDGCLELLSGSHKLGVIEHESTYMDPDNRRNLRQIAKGNYEDEFEHVCVEGEAGDIVINHFNTLHRSGRNVNKRIRYTLLARASNIFCEGFQG